MTTHGRSLNAFAVAARQGRTREPLDILGCLRTSRKRLPLISGGLIMREISHATSGG
jgi:hypothetical protein